jgi:hypothetical protein
VSVKDGHFTATATVPVPVGIQPVKGDIPSFLWTEDHEYTGRTSGHGVQFDKRVFDSVTRAETHSKGILFFSDDLSEMRIYENGSRSDWGIRVLTRSR